MGTVDLHLHSNASDGVLAPGELVRVAAGTGLSVISITDHDTVAGIPEALAAAKVAGIRVIPGVEISTDHKGVQAHILGYFVDYESDAFLARLDSFRLARLERANRILGKLDTLGIVLPRETVSDADEVGVVGRPHIARAMIAHGYVDSMEEAFGRYLSPGQQAYIPRAKLTPAEAIGMIRAAAGLPVLAHPWSLTYLLDDLADKGLVGLEVYYRDYDACQVGRLSRIAKEMGLVRTGGSDFHAMDGGPTDLGQANVPERCVQELDELRNRLR